MRKIYTATVATLLLTSIFTVANAQRKIGSLPAFAKKITVPSVSNVVSGTTADCDTVNYPIPETWNLVISGPLSGNTGFILGTNEYGDLEKANYFDLSATGNAYITGASIFFGAANSTVAGNLSKDVVFKVYEDAAGEPGTQIGSSVSVPLSQIKSDVEGGFTTDILFPSPIQLPASKKFYVSVDISNFAWNNPGTKDSICIVSNDQGETVPADAWEKWSDGTWYNVGEAWTVGGFPYDVTAIILPYVSTTSEGCAVLPVKLLSFNAQRNNKDVTLNWQIAEEYNMKGYEVQRADNNGAFKTVISVPAVNNAKNQSYSVTDKNAFTAASTVQYRLKQIDGDGSAKYSRVISVKANAVISDITFANPFNGALKLQLNLATSQNISVQLFDMQGKPVVTEQNKMYNASSNTIVLNGTSALKPGMYVLKVTAGTEHLQYKVIKQ